MSVRVEREREREGGREGGNEVNLYRKITISGAARKLNCNEVNLWENIKISLNAL